MNFIHQIERLQKLNKLIEHECTGTPDELAEKLGISKRQLHNLLDTLRNIGGEIEFCQKSKTYLFRKAKLRIDFSLTRISDKEIEKIHGGFIKNLNECNFISLNGNSFTSSSMIG